MASSRTILTGCEGFAGNQHKIYLLLDLTARAHRQGARCTGWAVAATSPDITASHLLRRHRHGPTAGSVRRFRRTHLCRLKITRPPLVTWPTALR
jgi:hypothetical protein